MVQVQRRLSPGLIKAEVLSGEHGQEAGGEGVGSRLFYSARLWSKWRHFRRLYSVTS